MTRWFKGVVSSEEFNGLNLFSGYLLKGIAKYCPTRKCAQQLNGLKVFLVSEKFNGLRFFSGYLFLLISKMVTYCYLFKQKHYDIV